MNNINLLKNNTNNNFNNEKAHYFIGTVIDNKNLKKELLKLIKSLRKRYKLQDFHTNKGSFVVNHLYLGYFDYETVKLYMNDILKYLLKAIADNFSELKCDFKNYNLSGDKVYYNISLQLSDKNNYIQNKIIPYLMNEGVKDITNKRSFFRKPTINLIYYKDSPIIKSRQFEIGLQLPQSSFLVNNMCLIKGTPIKLRSGNPSLHDQMVLEPINEYRYNFNGKLGSNNSTINLLGLKNNNSKPSKNDNNGKTNSNNNVNNNGKTNGKTNGNNNGKTNSNNNGKTNGNNNGKTNSNNNGKTNGNNNGKTNGNNSGKTNGNSKGLFGNLFAKSNNSSNNNSNNNSNKNSHTNNNGNKKVNSSRLFF